MTFREVTRAVEAMGLLPPADEPAAVEPARGWLPSWPVALLLAVVCVIADVGIAVQMGWL